MTKKATFTCSFDAQKLDAMRTFAVQKGIDLEAELTNFLEKKYERLVPKNVRQYIAGFDGVPQKPAVKKATESTAKFAESESDCEAEIETNKPESSSEASNSPIDFWS